jgi:hypothetical protein
MRKMALIGNHRKCGIAGRTVLLLLMSALYGCGGYLTAEERKEEIFAWANSEKTRVEKGALTNSGYWIAFFQKTIYLRPDLDDFLYFANEMIKTSRILEEEKITKEQFEDKQHELTALLDQEERRRAKALGGKLNYEYDGEVYLLYRSSLFIDYLNDLQRRLKETGPQFSVEHCAFFGNGIQCTRQKPAF